METLKLQDINAILGEVTKIICDNAMHLCELDSVVGDGDHGTTIRRGVKAAQIKIEEEMDEIEKEHDLILQNISEEEKRSAVENPVLI